MTKLNETIKRDIYFKVNEGCRIVDIMKETGLSRSTIQRLINSYNIDSKEDIDTKKDIEYIKNNESENDINDLLNDLNEEVNDPIVNKSKPEPKQLNTVISLEHDAKFLDIMNSLGRSERVFEPPMSQQSMSQQSMSQPPKKIVVAADKDYISKRNLIDKVKRYLLEFEKELENIHDGDPVTFKHRLQELNTEQLEILIQNIQFEINIPKTRTMFNSAFFILTNQMETLTCKFGYDINGMSKLLQQNEDVNQALRELSCQIDLSSYTTPEMRLGSAVLLTAMTCYNQNKLNSKMNDFLNEPVDEEVKEKYKSL